MPRTGRGAAPALALAPAGPALVLTRASASPAALAWLRCRTRRACGRLTLSVQSETAGRTQRHSRTCARSGRRCRWFRSGCRTAPCRPPTALMRGFPQTSKVSRRGTSASTATGRGQTSDRSRRRRRWNARSTRPWRGRRRRRALWTRRLRSPPSRARSQSPWRGGRGSAKRACR